MMPRPDGDALLIQQGTKIFRMSALQQEAEHTDPIPLGTETPKTPHRLSQLVTAPQQQLLMLLSCPSVQTLHPAHSGTNPTVPILFLTGNKDTTVSPSSVLSMYNSVHGVEKVFAEVNGSSHIDATGEASKPEGCKPAPLGCNGPNHEDPYAYDWLSCKLKGDVAACARVTTCKQPHLTTGVCHHDAK